MKKIKTPKRQQKIIKMTKAQHNQITEKLIKEIFALTVYELHDTHGFGRKRNQQLLDSITETLEHVKQGYVTLEDIIQEVENMGVKI